MNDFPEVENEPPTTPVAQAGQTMMSSRRRPAKVSTISWQDLLARRDVSSYSSFDVSPDGERFVMQETLPESQARITIVENWYEEFRDREQN